MFSHDNQTIIHYYNTRFRRLFFLHEANLKAFLCFTYQRESRIKIEDTRHANDQYLFPQSTSFPLQAFSEGVDMALDLRTKHILSGCLFLSPPPPSGGGGGGKKREPWERGWCGNLLRSRRWTTSAGKKETAYLLVTSRPWWSQIDSEKLARCVILYLLSIYVL